MDEIIVMVNKHGVFYPHYDALGNVTMLTDSAGKLVERYGYSVGGQVSLADDQGNYISNSSVGNRWYFTGREWLNQIGLYDYRNRVYSAGFGRFLQTDPIRFDGGDINIYRYVANSPVNRGDAYGLGPEDGFAGMTGMTGAQASTYGNLAAGYYQQTGQFLSPNSGTLAIEQFAETAVIFAATVSAFEIGAAFIIVGPSVPSILSQITLELSAISPSLSISAYNFAASQAFNSGRPPFGSLVGGMTSFFDSMYSWVNNLFE